MHVKLAERLASSGLKLLQVIKPSTWILKPQWSITVVHIFILLLLLVGFHFHTSWIVLKSSVPARRGLHVYFGLQWGQWDQWGSVGSGGVRQQKVCVSSMFFFFCVCKTKNVFKLNYPTVTNPVFKSTIRNNLLLFRGLRVLKCCRRRHGYR